MTKRPVADDRRPPAQFEINLPSAPPSDIPAINRTAILRLWDWLLRTHWDGESLAGPDPIGRLNWRVWRFVKAYTPGLPWRDRYAYEQAQAYWLRANLCLARLFNEERGREIARRAADGILARQQADGAWEHPPLRERRGKRASVEGTWASLGLVAAYREFKRPEYLEAALQWRKFVEQDAGLLQFDNGLAVRYYHGAPAIIPNVSTVYLWLLAELHDLTGERSALDTARAVLDYLRLVQLPTGELPYEVPVRPHFMCYQYNAFEFLDLVGYWRLTRDPEIQPVLKRLAGYLRTGLSSKGAARYNCSRELPEVHYWTAALGAALHTAAELGLHDSFADAERAFRHLLTRRAPGGEFPYSRGNYKFLEDRRSYPRPQAMILSHLLLREDVDLFFAPALH